MRIRKRQVPFSLSSLASVTLSDPLLSRSPVVQLQLQDATHPKASDPLGNLTAHRERGAHFDHQPSDQPNQRLLSIERGSSGLDCSDNASGTHKEKKKKDFSELLQGEYERGGEVEKGNDIRKGGILGAETVTGVLPESRAIYQASGTTWCDAEKSFPPKKRRSSFERSRSSEDAMMEKDKKMKTKMKTKMISSNKCAQQIDNEEFGEEKETKARGLENTGAKKLRARGGAVMEGSRCSRVNGRGWRCCQQTLVGYSLCEHHLGKGRLRSMTSVRSRSLAGSNSALTALKRDESEPLSTTSSSLLENELKDSVLDNDGEADEDENKPLMFTKKRMKLGMVKARSISSLLGQTNNGTVVADNQYY